MKDRLPFESRPYRLGVGIVLLNAEGHAFAAQRMDSRDPAWQFPQGGIDEGENPLEAALREMKEEIGTDRAEVVAESSHWLSYDLPPDLADKVWKGRYRGQKQKWFALRFLGTDADIDINTEHPEFSAWQWMPLEEVPRFIVPFKRALYDMVAAEFAPVARRLAAEKV